MRNLVVCCDGTWNTPDDMDLGLPAPTNVFKFYRSLSDHDSSDGTQLAYYHPGVGTTGNWWDRVSGGAMGQGLSANVKSGYRWLAGHYQPGDRIWLLGFSRGAYTARSLGGMISSCGLYNASQPGLTNKRLWEAVEAVFGTYREPKETRKPIIASKDRPFFNAKLGEPTSRSTAIHFIGVWDTVGALGIPDDLALLNLIDNPEDYQFHDTTLSPIVRHARHAIAMDEMRQSFVPTLWAKPDEGSPDLVQRWFPGVHSDVGGGYSRAGLSNGALAWMVGEAERVGLAFKSDAKAQISEDPGDVLHNSMTGLFKALKSSPRAVPQIDGKDAFDWFHASVAGRRGNSPIWSSDYWPLRSLHLGQSVALDIYARERWNPTGVYVEKGVSYTFKATGEWMDASVACGPAGPKTGQVDIGEIAHTASALLGKLEGVYQRLAKSKATDFWWTKRCEEHAFFALVGVIASGEQPGSKPGDPLHETFLIGKGVTITPKTSGYLYCFANDAWQAYANNKGSVKLTVARH